MGQVSPARLALALAAVISTATAQDRSDDRATSPQARRDQLARVQEMLADPDTLMRLANMEAIAASGDVLNWQVGTCYVDFWPSRK